jgi:Icc protein
MPPRPLRWLCPLLAWAGLASSGCLRFTPFQTDLDEGQRDQTRKNLERLADDPVPVGPVRLAFVSDTHWGLEELHAIVDWVNAQGDVSLLLHGGDLTEFGSRQEYVWAHDALRRLRVPWFVAPGNHDLLASGADLYGEMFGPRNVAFDGAGYRFLLLDTNTFEPERRALPLAWLGDQLATMPEGMRAVVFTHHPPDSRPDIRPDEEPAYRRLQREGRVAVNLHGHLHSREYVRQDGPVTHVNARGGLRGHFVLVTLDGDAVEVRRCDAEGGCGTPVPPEPVAADEGWPP